ncbi:hypothetical protein [Mycetohabitans sp. B46]|uniref:hypothetical protein n=1 Tax=Mycetohabitans sp. B46 TaxID=2772536 RepID=UPI00307F2CCD
MKKSKSGTGFCCGALRARLGTIDLNTPRALTLARVWVPCLFGLYSLWLGADANWDLYNYHLYNAFAWLHGKLQTDLAPAGLQSYFNPLLDVPFYLANTHLPSRLVGFAMGVLHGLNFVLILAIVQRALPLLPDTDRYRVPLLLALAGCLTANFLSGLGNSMGDDTTAMFALAGLLALLTAWEQLGQWSIRTVAMVLGSGMVVGLGVGLKLTNAVYAVAMCAALLSYPGRVSVKLRIAVLFGIGVLFGLATTGGYWMLQMWQTFGNPLYPQFGVLFPNPLATPDVMGDTRWRPRDWLETVLWPFIFTENSRRVGETPIRQIIWPMTYLLFWCWIVTAAIRRPIRGTTAALVPRARFIVLFVAMGYVVWMQLFSIYRYLVVVEVLTPLVIWILLHRLLPYRHAVRAATVLLSVATLVVVAGGARTWGHERWADPLYHAEVPTIEQPERTTVVLATTHARAWAWLATLFSDQVAFTQIDSSFPGTPVFNERMRAIAAQRGGSLYAIVDGEYNWRIDNVARIDHIVKRIGLTGSERGCKLLHSAVERLRLHAAVVPSADHGRQCELGLRADDVRDILAENRANVEQALPIFERNGFVLHPATCVPYRAGIGKGVMMYQWCQISLHGSR